MRLGQKNMLSTLERAIDSGCVWRLLCHVRMCSNNARVLCRRLPVLIENMGEKIDAVLGPVIARATMKKVPCVHHFPGERAAHHMRICIRGTSCS